MNFIKPVTCQLVTCNVALQLNMDYFVVSGSSSLHHGLAHCRVRVNRFDDVMSGSFYLAGKYHLGDHFGHVHTHHVSAQQGIVGSVEDQFDESFVCSGCARFA